MTDTVRFTADDLTVILSEGSGFTGDLADVESLDVPFDVLGCDSLAVLETASRIERTYRVSLGEDLLTPSLTPRQMISAVESQLADGTARN